MALIDVVRWVSTPDVFAWRFPETNLTTFTQLIVSETQEAVLFHKGRLLKVFGPGKHTLSTENIPLLENLFGIPFGGENPFTAEVWFVNRVTVLDVKWGTQKPFLLRDPEFGIMVPVRGFGQFGVRIADSEKFLVRLVGSLSEFDRERLVAYFKGLLISRATSVIARTVGEEKISVLDIAAHISELSDALAGEMKSKFAEFGIELVDFFVNSVSVPEDDPAVVSLRDSLSKRADMKLRGYTYQQDRSFDVMNNASQNEGMAGTMMGTGMGLGMGFGAGGAVGGMMRDLSSQIRSDEGMKPVRECPSCKAFVPQDARFCPSCGEAFAEAAAPAPAAVRCVRCGASVPEGAKFCPGCGTSVRAVCPACGREAAANAVFCAECGAKIRK